MTSTSSRFATKAGTAVAALLEQVLTHESALAAATRDYVWRVRGSPLQSLKRLFTEQGRQIEHWLMALSEQAAAIGLESRDAQPPESTEPSSAPVAEGRRAVTELLSRHEGLARELDEALETLRRREMERTIEPVLTQLRDFHETSAWMLRLLLQSPEPARL